MSVSYCKDCKTAAVGHKVIELCRAISNHALISVILLNNKTLYHWKCSHCNYESLRFSDKNNAEQFYPIEPLGKGLDNQIPKDIRKDFDEARLIANYSPRAGNVLLRTCLERICNWIASDFLEDSSKDAYPREVLNRKIEYLQAHTHFINKDFKDIVDTIKDHGNDVHANKKIIDSDTIEAFQDMSHLIESICDKVLRDIKDREIVENRNANKIQNTSQS